MWSCSKHCLVDDGLECDGLVEDGLVEDALQKTGSCSRLQRCGQCADVEDVAFLYLRHS